MNLNGLERAEHDNCTVAALMQAEGIPQRGVAVAINSSVLRRSEWATTVVQPGDSVEIVTAVAGG